MLCLPSLVLLHPLFLINYGFEMENISKSVNEELDALRSALPQLILQVDKCRFTIFTIEERSQHLNEEDASNLGHVHECLFSALRFLTEMNVKLYE